MYPASTTYWNVQAPDLSPKLTVELNGDLRGHRHQHLLLWQSSLDNTLARNYTGVNNRLQCITHTIAYKLFISILHIGPIFKIKRVKIPPNWNQYSMAICMFTHRVLNIYQVSQNSVQFFKRSCTYKLFITRCIFNMGPKFKFQKDWKSKNNEIGIS